MRIILLDIVAVKVSLSSKLSLKWEMGQVISLPHFPHEEHESCYSYLSGDDNKDSQRAEIRKWKNVWTD